jgi:hypothetical protein
VLAGSGQQQLANCTSRSSRRVVAAAAGSASTTSRRGARLGTAAVVPLVIRVRSRIEVVPVRPAEKLRQADKS